MTSPLSCQPSDYCCEWMSEHATSTCSEHPERETCPDTVVHRYVSGFGIPVHDGGASYIEISYCPSCGSELRSRS